MELFQLITVISLISIALIVIVFELIKACMYTRETKEGVYDDVIGKTSLWKALISDIDNIKYLCYADGSHTLGNPALIFGYYSKYGDKEHPRYSIIVEAPGRHDGNKLYSFMSGVETCDCHLSSFNRKYSEILAKELFMRELRLGNPDASKLFEDSTVRIEL